MNYFELFNFSPAFQIDLTVLAERYRELQRTVHPDNFANASEQQKLLAVQRTAQVNDGYQALKDPVRRAEHILFLRGIDISHETTTVKDTAFLMQQMEWREALEDITSVDDVASLYDEFSDYQKLLTVHLSSMLASDNTHDWSMAADDIRKLKFMIKLHDELVRIEDALYD